MSRAWFALAVAGVLGLFYVGAGLRGGPTVGVAFGQDSNEPNIAARLKWEMLAGNAAGATPNNLKAAPPSRVYRSKIPGGWLVETYRPAFRDGLVAANGVGLAFVPDPEHKWDGNSLQ
jgi:hypothetical protein